MAFLTRKFDVNSLLHVVTEVHNDIVLAMFYWWSIRHLYARLFPRVTRSK
jgi:hypothetical protein